MQTSCSGAEAAATVTEWSGPLTRADCNPACAAEETSQERASPAEAAPLHQVDGMLRQSRNPSLLQISDDERLANSRKPLLKMAGFDVHTCGILNACSLDEARALQLVAVVFCQSVPSDMALTLSHFLSYWNREIRIVRFSKRPWQEQDAESYHLLLQAPLAPQHLVSTMMRLRAQA